MKSVLSDWSQANKQPKEAAAGSNDAWKDSCLIFSARATTKLLATICRKLTNYLLIKGVEEASEILSIDPRPGGGRRNSTPTLPRLKEPIADIIKRQRTGLQAG